MTPVPNAVEFRGDEIGEWTEVKLDVVKQYAIPYSKILAAQPCLHHEYIDGFAGAGLNRSRLTGDFVPGSPMNALLVEPPFEHYHFIDLDDQKVEALTDLARDRPDVDVYLGDCNQILLQKILPKVLYADYRRALCLLDPYGMHLNWEIVQRAGRMGTIDMLLNFPIGTINRNALWKEKAQVSAARTMSLDRVWGDRSWQEVAYRVQPGLFEEFTEKTTNAEIGEAFRRRLIDVAGFKYVPQPLPMRNSKGTVLYYLYFASQQQIAVKIITAIFDKYRGRGFR